MTIASTAEAYFRLMGRIEQTLRGVRPAISPVEAFMLQWIGDRTVRSKEVSALFGATGRYAVYKLVKVGLVKIAGGDADKRSRFFSATDKAKSIQQKLSLLDRSGS